MKKLLLSSLLLVGFVFGQTGTIELTPRTGSNRTLVKNATVYIVNNSTSDSLLLSEYTGSKAGTYYRAATPYGSYKVYVNGNKVKDTEIFGFSGEMIASNTIDSTKISSIPNSVVTTSKLANSSITSAKIAIDAITSSQILNSSITYSDLASTLRSLLSGNLYDYQDATVNQSLQMYVRWAFYLHEAFYNETTNLYNTQYDASGVNFLKTRTPLIAHMELLMALHQKTGRSLYWNELLSLYQATWDSCEVDTVFGHPYRTVDLAPLANGEDNFTHYDVPFHILGYYIYSQDNSYTQYLTEFNNFADALYSTVDKDASEGWGWGYRWNATGGISNLSGVRINVNFPQMYFYAYMKGHSLTTNTITSALCDTLVDSIYTFIHTNGWVTSGSSGGYSLTPADNDIEEDYMYDNTIYMFRVSEALSDTSWVPTGTSMTWTQIMNYCIYYLFEGSSGTNYFLMQKNRAWLKISIRKWGQKYGMTFPEADLANANEVTALSSPYFSGKNFPVNALVHYQRATMLDLNNLLFDLITYFNDETFASEYLSYAKDNGGSLSFAINGTTYYLSDGHLVRQSTALGHLLGSKIIGYYHKDTSPNCEAMANWSYNTNNNVLSINYDNINGGAITYDFNHKMGTPYSFIYASAADSVLLAVDNPTAGGGSYVGDSLYFFFYNVSGELDTVSASSLAVGDSFYVDFTKGIFCNTASTVAPSSGKNFGGIAFNGTGYLKKQSHTYYLPNVTTDTLLVFTGDHDEPTFYLASGWPYAFVVAEQLLEHVRTTFLQGFSYDGILEDKTQ